MTHVTAIHIAESPWPQQVHPVEEVAAIAGHGLVGDRKYGTKRQISLVSEEELADAAARFGSEIPAGATRRQITISEGRFTRNPGDLIRVGEVLVSVIGNCSPCDEMEQSIGPGARASLVDLAGVTGTIIEGGTIRVGDPVEFD